MKTCDDVLDLLPDALPWIRGEALEVHDHLKVCDGCAETVQNMAHTLDVLQTNAPEAPELGEDFADALMAKLPATPVRTVVSNPRAEWGLRAAAAALIFAAGFYLAGVGEDPRSARTPTQPTVSAPIPQTPARRNPRVQRPLPRVAATPVARSAADMDDPLGHYVTEASLVLQAVERLDASDPQALRLLAYHVRETDLLDQGDRLLVALRGAERDERLALRPLISGTQLILRKVRHARADSAPQTVWTIRQEVRQTKILDAYKQLLAAQRAADADRPL